LFGKLLSGLARAPLLTKSQGFSLHLQQQQQQQSGGQQQQLNKQQLVAISLTILTSSIKKNRFVGPPYSQTVPLPTLARSLARSQAAMHGLSRLPYI
jgi:hypothetical protein